MYNELSQVILKSNFQFIIIIANYVLKGKGQEGFELYYWVAVIRSILRSLSALFISFCNYFSIKYLKTEALTIVVKIWEGNL